MRSIVLVAALLIGSFFPIISALEPIITYFLAGMLFFAFLDLKITKEAFHYSHLAILSINLLLALVTFFILKNINYNLATAVFLITFAPTAISAPGVASYLKTNVTYVAFSTLLTNIVVISLIPVLIPHVLHSRAEVSVLGMLPSLSTIFIVPFALARIIYFNLPKTKQFLLKFKDLGFVFFAANICIASAKAVQFIHDSKQIPATEIALVIGISGIVALLSFAIGYIIAGKKHPYISPYAALAPISYILWQNLIVSWIMKKFQPISSNTTE